MQLYKNVFSPYQDHTLAFIGFVQPASGGVLSMSEMQARWWAELCRGTVKLPSKQTMLDDIVREKVLVIFIIELPTRIDEIFKFEMFILFVGLVCMRLIVYTVCI